VVAIGLTSVKFEKIKWELVEYKHQGKARQHLI
jgi:hypothetical protein